MAKLKMPLMSAGASGSLAGAVVHFPWKGLNCVREYVIPANPKSDAQTAQRNKMTAAVTEYHGALYNALDMTAFARYGGTIKAAMTGFNTMVREYVKEAILGNVWERINGVTTYDIGATAFTVHLSKVSGGNAPTVRYGTRKTFMPLSATLGDLTGDLWEKAITGLLADTLYYFYIDCGTTGTDFGRTGIYSQRTTAV